jgi:hypothetical protein
MDASQWHVRHAGRVEGPVDEATLRAMIADGRARPWMEFSANGATWSRGSALPHLFPSVVAAPQTSGGSRSRSFRGSGARARPMTGLLDVDVWSRRWAVALGIALLLGISFPVLLPGRVVRGGLEGFVNTDPSETLDSFRRTQLAWPWEPAMVRLGYWGAGTWIALGLGIGVIVVARALAGVGRAMALFFGGLGAFLGSSLLQDERNAFSNVGSEMGLGASQALLYLMLLSSGAVAVGTHVRKRFPDSPAARHLAGLGGGALVFSFLLPVLGGPPVMQYVFEPLFWSILWPVNIMLLASIAYGVVGFSCYSTAASVTGRCALASLLARVLAVGFPSSLLLTMAIHGPDGMFGMMATLIVKGALLVYGQLFLIVVGLAAWMDAALQEKTPQPLDPARLAQVFR